MSLIPPNVGGAFAKSIAWDLIVPDLKLGLPGVIIYPKGGLFEGTDGRDIVIKSSNPIRDAINLLPNGGIIYLKQGTYPANAIDLPENIVLMGQHRRSTFLRPTKSVPYVVSMRGQGTHLSQLFIDAAGLATIAVDASRTSSISTFSSIHRCSINNAISVNLDLTNNEDIHILDTVIAGAPTGCRISGSEGDQLFIKVLFFNNTQQDLLIDGNTSVFWNTLIVHSANVANANIYITGAADHPALSGLNLWANNQNGKRNVHKDSAQGGVLYLAHANLFVGAAPAGQKNIGGTWNTLWAEALIANLGADVSQSLRYYYYFVGDTTIHTNLTFAA